MFLRIRQGLAETRGLNQSRQGGTTISKGTHIKPPQ
jgi:hypothetical protein